ncbi:MAG: alpha/beta fold hydrolase [Gammaproteobacteria bacterium]|nr:alpha/beta fold hydrolase [Gammaproteobacteria bacterium]
MADYIITVRNLRRGDFGTEPGPTRFLAVPGNRTPHPDQAIKRGDWVDAVFAAGHTGQDVHTGEDCGDIVVFVHGYNTSPGSVARRHRQFRRDLTKAGFRCAFVSFDWPSDDRAINYLEDRSDAKRTALRLVDDGISLLAATQFRGCKYNVHVVAHSMGSYVLREAFDDADDRPGIAASNWTVSQVCLVGADVSRGSMSAGDSRSRSLYRHCTRLTNYQNPYDQALKLSNVKRAGVAPRAGRRGLPDDHADKAVNVNCGSHYRKHYGERSDNGHSWYFEDEAFLADLAATLSGDRDRRVIGRRRLDGRGELHMV